MSEKIKLTEECIRQQEFILKLRQDWREEHNLNKDIEHKKEQHKFWQDTKFYWAILTLVAIAKIIFD